MTGTTITSTGKGLPDGARQRAKITRWLAALPLALFVATAPPALAADAKGKFSIRGAGTVSCAVFVNATPTQRKHAETWWAGYLTAMNRTTPNTFEVLGKITPTQANNWLVAYCRKYPNHRYATAVHQMLLAAYPRRTTSAPSNRKPSQRRGNSEPDPFDGLLDKPTQ